jgi:hypothetical protein
VVVVLVDPRHVDVADVGVGRDVVVGEVVVHPLAERRVEDRLLHQRHRQTHRHPAEELRPRRRGVHDAPRREHAHHARDAHLARVDVDARLHELSTERVTSEVLVERVDVVLGVDRDAHTVLGHRVTCGPPAPRACSSSPASPASSPAHTPTRRELSSVVDIATRLRRGEDLSRSGVNAFVEQFGLAHRTHVR